MKRILTILSILICSGSIAQTYNPTQHTTTNKAMGFAQATPGDGRSMFYDGVNFVYRDYNGTAEALTYLNLSKYRTGGFPIFVHFGGILSGGVWTGGVRLIYWFKDGTADGNLVRWYTDSTSVINAVVYVKRLTDSTFYAARVDSTRDTVLIRGTAAGGISSLVLNAPSALFNTPVNFSNGGGGAWSGSMTLLNENPNYFFTGPASGGPAPPTFRQMVTADLPSGIPNSKLQNSSMGFAIASSGSSPNWTSTPIPLGGTATLNIPITSATNTGIVNPTLYNFWTFKVDSTVMSNDSVYEWRNGTRYYRYFIIGGGGGGAILTFGYGLTGGSYNGSSPVTTTVDSATLAAYFLRRKDSTLYATQTQLATKQNQLSGSGYLKFASTTPSYLTPTQVTADLNLFTSTLQGLVPSSGGGSTNFLRADGIWAAPAGGGSVTSVGLALPVSVFSISGSPVTGAGTLTGAFISQSAYTGFGNWTGSGAVPTFGKIPYQAFATGPANYILGYDGSGNPAQLAPDTLFQVNRGSSGVSIAFLNNDTLYTNNLKQGTGITLTKGSDSAITIATTALIDPLTTNGDIIARIGGVTTRLPQGSNGTFLGVSGGVLGYYSAGGGGSQTLQQVYTTGSTLTQINTINNGGFRQTSTNGLNIFDSIGISLALTLSDSIIVFDNSIGAGTGASSSFYQYASIVSYKYRSSLSNYSVSGTNMQVDGFGKIPLIPSYVAGLRRYLIIGYVENDINNVGALPNMDTAHCGPNYRAFVDTAIARGWPASRIILRGPVWISPAGFANATLVRQAQYFAMVQSIATTRGCVFVDCFNPFVYRGTANLMFDQVLHPNNTGHALIAQLIYKAVGDSARTNGTVGFLNNKTTDLRTVFYQGNDSISNKGVPIMVDTNGKVGRAFPDQVILNSQTLPQAQASSINLTGTGFIGNGANAAMPASITFSVTGMAQATALRAVGSSPSGLTGAGVEIAYTSNTGNIFAYDRTGAAAKDLAFSSLGAHTLFGTTTPTGGPEIVQISAGMSAVFGRFTGNLTGSGFVGPSVEVQYNTGSDYGSVIAYNRTTSAGKNLILGAGLSPVVIAGGTTATGTSAFQVTGNEYVSGKIGIVASAPTALLELGSVLSSPTTGRKGTYFSSDTGTITYNLDIPLAIDHFFGRKTLVQTTAHTIHNNYVVWIEKDTAGTNATIIRNRALMVTGQSKFMDSILIGGLKTGSSSDSVLVWNSTDSSIKKIAQNSLGGIPAGSNTQVQFNNSGAFGASANLTWDGTILTSTGMSISTLISAGANDSVLMWNPSTKRIEMKSAVLPLYGANGITLAGGDSIYWNGPLNQNVTIANAGFNTTFSGNGLFSVTSPMSLGVASASDANYTVGNETTIKLSTVITANRTLTLPNVATYSGRHLTIINYNTSLNGWTTSPTIVDGTGTGLSVGIIPNGATVNVVSDGSNWVIKNIQFPVTMSTAGGWAASITSGTSSTIANNVTNILFNPSSLIATYTLTLPSNPVDAQLIKIHFGGTIAGNSTVVTALTISPNSGQTIEQKVAPTTGLGGDCYIYQYNLALGIWYRQQ